MGFPSQEFCSPCLLASLGGDCPRSLNSLLLFLVLIFPSLSRSRSSQHLSGLLTRGVRWAPGSISIVSPCSSAKHPVLRARLGAWPASSSTGLRRGQAGVWWWRSRQRRFKVRQCGGGNQPQGTTVRREKMGPRGDTWRKQNAELGNNLLWKQCERCLR